MKLLYASIQGLPLFKDGLIVNLIAQQKITENNEFSLSHLVGNVYKQDIIGIIGINASGKTLTLKWISFLLDMYLLEVKVNEEKYEELLQKQELTMEAYFADDSVIYKVESVIAPDTEGNYVFKEEKIWEKKLRKSMNRNNILLFEEAHLQVVRSKEETLFLSDQLSIMISRLKRQTKSPEIVNLLQDTDINLMRVAGKVPGEVVQFLDNSIEYIINEKETNEKMRIRLKFKHQYSEIEINDLFHLSTYLSSGTIKGLNVFAGMQHALVEGGIILLDEIENHFNKVIVRVILQLFKNKKINKLGATLIFSTHYAELLDEFERNDSIYVAMKNKSLQLRNLNNLLKRNDFKKSEIYASSYVGKTAPSYEAYMDFKKYFIKSSQYEEDEQNKRSG